MIIEKCKYGFVLSVPGLSSIIVDHPLIEAAYSRATALADDETRADHFSVTESDEKAIRELIAFR